MVVALALAAVVGAMSLANPALAGFEAPADSRLTERTFSPQVTTLEADVYNGEDTTFDLIPHLGGREDDVTDIDISPTTGTPSGIATFAEVDSRRDVGITISPADAGAPAIEGATTTTRVTVTLGEGANANEMVFFLRATWRDITGAQRSEETQDTVTIPAGAEDDEIGMPVFLKVDNLFVDGKGDATPEGPGGLDGKITVYTPASSSTDVTVGYVTVISDTTPTPAVDRFSLADDAGTAIGFNSTNALAEYLNAKYVVTTGDNPVAASAARFSAEIAKLIDIEINDLDVGDRTGYIFLYATAGADENDFSTITVTGDDGLEGEGNDDPQQSFLAIVGPPDRMDDDDESGMLPMFTPDSKDPAKNTRYSVKFDVNDDVNTLQHELVIEFHEDYNFPGSIRTSSVTINTSGGTNNPETRTSNPLRGYTFTPEDVVVDGTEVFISVGDMDERDDHSDHIVEDGTTMEVVFRTSAGISNPSGFGDYFLAKISFGDGVDEGYDEDSETPMGLATNVPRKLSLDEDAGGLNDPITATAKGFKGGTTLTVFVDQRIPVMWDGDGLASTARTRLTAGEVEAYNMAVEEDPTRGNVPMIPVDDDGMPDGDVTMTYNMFPSTVDYVSAPNGKLDVADVVLCRVSKISGANVGSCEFKITHPTFQGGKNLINAKDGRSGYPGDNGQNMPADLSKLAVFELEASVSATPDGGSPGEIMVVQVVDFPEGGIGKVEFARETWCPSPRGAQNCPGSVDSTGSGSFQIQIPNWASAGVQELRVTSAVDSGVKASANVTFVGPQITVTPGEVLANQRISLVGTGFSPGAVIANAIDSSGVVDPVVTIGGESIIWSRINDNDPVTVDSGGNWSASVDLPLAEATTAEGERAIRVTDSRGRTGGALVDIPSRTVTVTPDSGRVGTIAVVRGTGFPSKNDDGSSFNITVLYDANNNRSTTVSAQPDASGRFEAQLRIPTTAAIPSTNTVRVSFQDDDMVTVVTTVAHEVPEGTISVTPNSGGPGTTIHVVGDGFKSHVPVSLVRIGSLDITPAPKPSTDPNGMLDFTALIPGLDVGIQTVEVRVGDTTSSVGFTVIQSGINPGDIKPVAEALEALGDNLDSVWHFNNDTKAWNFYDGLEGSDLTHLITGETYLLQIKSDQEVILNRDTRNLTCVGTNCWNQIVW